MSISYPHLPPESNPSTHQRHLEFFTSPSALLEAFPSSKPKLILAVPDTLSHGSSRSLFADFASVRGNVVVLTTRGGEPDALSRILFDKWNGAQKDEEKFGKGKVGSIITLNDSLHMKVRRFVSYD